MPLYFMTLPLSLLLSGADPSTSRDIVLQGIINPSREEITAEAVCFDQKLAISIENADSKSSKMTGLRKNGRNINGVAVLQSVNLFLKDATQVYISDINCVSKDEIQIVLTGKKFVAQTPGDNFSKAFSIKYSY